MKITSQSSIRLAIVLLCAIMFTNSKAQTTKKIAPEKPKLIIGIVVSQFRHDYISRYWSKYSENGFKQLVNRGTYCKNTSFSYLVNDQGVGTTTIATGTNPSEHGIVARSWYNSLKDEIEFCVADKTKTTVGGSFEAGRFSPSQIMCSTFGDELKLSNNFSSKIVSVSFEPASSVLSGGHTADAAYWFDIKNGDFITSSYYLDSLPDWVNSFNAKRFSDTYIEKEWTTLLPIEQYIESLPDNNPYENGFDGKNQFPYILKDLSKSLTKKEKYSALNLTPFGNNITKDFAIQAIINEELGKDDITDILMLNFTANDNIGNLFGSLSVEVEDAVLRLDQEIAHFLDFVDESIGKENVLIYFTSEQGISYNPEYLSDNNIPAGFFNSSSALSLLKSYLNNLYGKGDWVKQYHANQIYLNRTLIEDADLKLSDVQEQTANLLLQFHGVANTVTSTMLQNTNFTSGPFEKIQKGYSQKRSGDVIIKLQNGWIDKYSADNHSYGYDSRIPLIFYGWKVGRKIINESIDMTDIAPTISVLLEIAYPNAATGKPILGIVE